MSIKCWVNLKTSNSTVKLVRILNILIQIQIFKIKKQKIKKVREKILKGLQRCNHHTQRHLGALNEQWMTINSLPMYILACIC
jgi:hypothetical protein